MAQALDVMIKFGEVTGENTLKRNPCWPQISDHPYRILIVGGSGSKNECITQFNKPPTRY